MGCVLERELSGSRCLASCYIALSLQASYLTGFLSYWLLGQAVPAGSHVRLNLQTGAREVKLQDEDKFRSNLKGLKKGKRYHVNSRNWESGSVDLIILKITTVSCFLTQIHVALKIFET